MKKYSLYITALLMLTMFFSCENDQFIDEIFTEPKASFSINEKEYFNVFESIKFKNTGSGQKFVVWPGDVSHIYGQTGNNGYACNEDGTFSYSYQEPGEYTAVWIASSIKANGEIVTSKDSVKIKVVTLNGGLKSFSITRMLAMSEYGSGFFYSSEGEFVTENRIVCPMPYVLWPKAIKRTLGVKFDLESNFAKLYWETETGDIELQSESTTKVFRFDTSSDANGKLYPQTLKTKMSSGYETEYEIAAMIIPEFTSFSVNGVDAVKKRDLSAFNKFILDITLPAGTDKTALVPQFVVMNNDPYLIDSRNIVSVKVNGVEQTSGTTAVNFSAPVEYVITYSVPGSDGYTYTQDAYFQVTVK